MLNPFWLFLCPLISSLIVLIFPFRKLVVALSFMPLLFLINGGMQWVGIQTDLSWLPELSIHFHLSIDSLALLFLYLTAIVVPTSLLALPKDKLSYPRAFYGLVLLVQSLLIGFFMARDLVLFTFFWEAMLLPLYFIIHSWGSAKREEAGFKFIVYMIAGSALMVAAVLALYFASSVNGEATFNMDRLAQIAGSFTHAKWVAAVFLLAFCVKTPLFPFHAWLPDAYSQAPKTGTILLSALLSKAGIYGIVRIGIGFFNQIILEWSSILLALAIAGTIYGALAAWRQIDFKRLIAYSSFSHVNFILAGLFIASPAAREGAILQALNHGITITALFLVAGWLEERLGSTLIGHASGLAKYMPCLCWFTLFFVLSSVALPGTNNFIGELLILFGLFGEHAWLAAILGLSLIFSVVYMLRWMQKMYFNPANESAPLNDMKGSEIGLAIPLVALILWVGIYPAPLLNQISMVFKSFANT